MPLLVNKQNTSDNIVSDRAAFSEAKKKHILDVAPPSQTHSRSANAELAKQQQQTKLSLSVAESLNKIPTMRNVSILDPCKETPLIQVTKKHEYTQTEDPTKITEADALDWMYSDEEPTVDYWKTLAQTREQELRSVVEECDALRRQVELISNLNQYLMAQLEEREQQTNDSIGEIYSDA